MNEFKKYLEIIGNPVHREKLEGLLRHIADEIDFDLIDRIREYNIEDKKDMTRFWR